MFCARERSEMKLKVGVFVKWLVLRGCMLVRGDQQETARLFLHRCSAHQLCPLAQLESCRDQLLLDWGVFLRLLVSLCVAVPRTHYRAT